jgi:uncharacterized membrane protein (DUF485 family)
MRRFKALLPGIAVLTVAALVRLPALTAGLPYSSYVDENHILHPAVHLIAEKTWEPTQYSYPSFPIYLVAAAALAYSPVYEAVHGRPLREDLSPFPYRVYEILEPPELIVIARLVTLAFSLGIVVLTGLLARRLAGPAAGFFAAWLATLLPALVARGTPITVAPLVTFFSLATLLFVEAARDGSRPRRDTILAGVMTGLATACKYPAVLICLPVALVVLLSSTTWTEKLRRLVWAGIAAVVTTVIAMPPLVLRLKDVVHDLTIISNFYKTQDIGSYWEQATHWAEWDLPLYRPEVGIPFLILAAAGLLVALRDRRWARPAWGWLLFGVATGLLVAPYKFRVFRNLLALVPLACVLVALLYAKLRERMPRPVWIDLVAAVLPVVLFTSTLHSYIRYELQLQDSRERAIRWLQKRVGPQDNVIFAEELVFLPSRIATLKAAKTSVLPWGRAQERILKRRFRYAVLGDLTRRNGAPKIPPSVWARIHEDYRVEAKFGAYPTHHSLLAFRGNEQVIYIMKRVPKGGPRPRGAARRSASP